MDGLIKPDFEVSENAIKIMLPVFEKNADLTEDEIIIYKLLSKTMLKPISEVAPYVPFGKSKTTKLLKEMCQKGVITVEGKGKSTKYIRSSVSEIQRKYQLHSHQVQLDEFIPEYACINGNSGNFQEQRKEI